jgi:hypothetical protein
MRRTLGLILPVVVCAGCFSFGKRQGDVAEAGPPSGDRERTLEYWGKLRGVIGERSKSDSLQALTNIVQKQVDMVRNEPTEAVDTELVAAAEALAKSQEKVIELAAIADYRFEALRVPQVAKEFAQANQQASAATARLKSLRAKLSARYGVNFPPLDG